MRVHLDTDLGGDPDDLCALALLLGWPDVELVGITTTCDRHGVRAAYVRHCLHLAGRDEIPVGQGAGLSLTTLEHVDPIIDDERFWPRHLVGQAVRATSALDLLSQNVERGTTLIGIGPSTNLAMLEIMRPGSLSNANVVLMGGWVRPPAVGLPQWGPDFDWNVQWDPRAVEVVAAAADVKLATLPATLDAHLTTRDLPRLRAAGPLGQLIARQSEAFARDRMMPELGIAHPGLPDDLLNFHYDPVACAVALGWPGATIEQMNLTLDYENGVARFRPDHRGRTTNVLIDVDGSAFTETWLAAVEAASANSRA